MRFARQPVGYSCGPTAILNAMKWAGLRYSVKKHHSFIVGLCASTHDLGTQELSFERALKGVGRGVLSVKRRSRPSLASVLGWINDPERAAILFYLYPGDERVEGHYTFIFSGDGGSVVCVNDRIDETVSALTRDELKERLRFMRTSNDVIPRIWFIRRTR